jgi:predicted metal-binding membrane protein
LNTADHSDEAASPARFIAVCAFAFVAGVITTAYFCRSMSGEMEMPGGWTMSMMWMRMDGQTWFASGISFLLMWLAMMVAMMLPSALPTFLRTRRQWTSLCYMASGYFLIWLAAGAVIYVPGVTFMDFAMRSESFSRAVPWLSAASLFAAGAIQFTPWKLTHLLRCRSSSGCAISCSHHERSLWLGCKQGAACFVCCAAPMMVLLVIGIMNPLAMTVIAIIIAAEKLLPRPEITARIVGFAAMLAGFAMVLWIWN